MAAAASDGGAAQAAPESMDAQLAPWRKLDMEKGGDRGQWRTPSMARGAFEEAVRESFPECAEDIIAMCGDWRTGALVAPDSEGEPPRICSERLFRWLYEKTPMHIGHKYRAVSVQYFKATVVDGEARRAGLDVSTANVHDLIKPVVRAKGPDVLCPRDGKPGAAYVDCVAGVDNVGLAVLMVKYDWEYKVGDIASGLLQYCNLRNVNPKRVYAWMCCLCINQHRAKRGPHRASMAPSKEEFGSRLEGIGRILVLMDSYQNADSKRLWSVFDSFDPMQAKEGDAQVAVTMPKPQEETLRKFSVESLTHQNGIDKLWKTLSGVDMKDASFTPAAGDVHFLQMIGNESHTETEYLQIWAVSVCESQLEPKQLDSFPPKEAVWLLVNVSSLLCRIGRHDMLNRAQDYLVQAQERLEKMKEEESTMGAFTQLTLGRVYEDLERWLAARGAYMRAVEMYGKLGLADCRSEAQACLERIEEASVATLAQMPEPEPNLDQPDQIVAVTWNVGVAFANPFEFWITYNKDTGPRRLRGGSLSLGSLSDLDEKESAFNDLVRRFEQYVTHPGDKDVQVCEIFPSYRFNELLDLMEQERLRSGPDDKRWSRLDVVRKVWRDYMQRKFISSFLVNEVLAKKRLWSQPDLDTSNIPLKGSPKPACRPSATTHYSGGLKQIDPADILPTDRWWMRWRNFMFHDSLDLEGGSTTRPVELLRPLQQTESLSKEEAEASVPLQLLNLALYDCALVHIMQDISPDGDWQGIKREVSKSIAERRLSRTLSILRDSYSDADVICLQKVPLKFQKDLVRAFESKFFIKFPAHTDNTVSATASVVMLRKMKFPNSNQVRELTKEVVDSAQQECRHLGKPLKPGELMVASAIHACGVPFIVASFHSDGNGIQSKPVASAVARLMEEKTSREGLWSFPSTRLVFGIDANSVDLQTKDEPLNIRDFKEHCLKEGLRSCFGTHRPEQWKTTCKARTYMQPQVRKAVAHERRLVANTNPMDHLLIRKGTFDVISCRRDNTGLGKYKEAQNIPSLEFPSDHAVVCARLGLPRLGWEVEEMRKNMFAALSDGRLEALVRALRNSEDDQDDEPAGKATSAPGGYPAKFRSQVNGKTDTLGHP